MYLSESKVERFYSVWFSLLHFVNQHRNVVPSFPKKWRDANVPPEVAVPVRDALWENDELLEAFIAENPAQLSQDDLALVESWKHHVAGNFFIFRHLKKYTIFVDENSPANAYGVHGITGPLEEIIGPYLPIYVKAVLLPFEDRIIYDSLLSSYPIHFGGGIKRSLNETYRRAQERGNLIISLQPGQRDTVEIAKTSNKKVLSAFQKALGKSGLTPRKSQEHSDVLTHFAEEFLQQQEPPKLLLDITETDVKDHLVSASDKVNLISFKRFVRFLRDSGRVDWDLAEDLLDYLKQEDRK